MAKQPNSPKSPRRHPTLVRTEHLHIRLSPEEAERYRNAYERLRKLHPDRIHNLTGWVKSALDAAVEALPNKRR